MIYFNEIKKPEKIASSLVMLAIVSSISAYVALINYLIPSSGFFIK